MTHDDMNMTTRHDSDEFFQRVSLHSPKILIRVMTLYSSAISIAIGADVDILDPGSWTIHSFQVAEH